LVPRITQQRVRCGQSLLDCGALVRAEQLAVRGVQSHPHRINVQGCFRDDSACQIGSGAKKLPCLCVLDSCRLIGAGLLCFTRHRTRRENEQEQR
jgi:hypothetical protein